MDGQDASYGGEVTGEALLVLAHGWLKLGGSDLGRGLPTWEVASLVRPLAWRMNGEFPCAHMVRSSPSIRSGSRRESPTSLSKENSSPYVHMETPHSDAKPRDGPRTQPPM